MECWQKEIDVRDFIQKNYTPYIGDESFLQGPTQRTIQLNQRFEQLKELEQDWGGVLDIDTATVSSLLNYSPGYLDRGQGADCMVCRPTVPLRRGINPFGGIRMVE